MSQFAGVTQSEGIDIDDDRNQTKILYLVDMVLEEVLLDRNQQALHLCTLLRVVGSHLETLAVDTNLVTIERDVLVRLETQSPWQFIIVESREGDVADYHRSSRHCSGDVPNQNRSVRAPPQFQSIRRP